MSSLGQALRNLAVLHAVFVCYSTGKDQQGAIPMSVSQP